jgi:hypothetical protein
MVLFEDRIASPVKRITLAQIGHLVAAQDPADGAGQQPQLGPGQSCPRSRRNHTACSTVGAVLVGQVCGREDGSRR